MSIGASSATRWSAQAGVLCDDGGHLIERQFPASKSVEALREFVDTLGDRGDLVGVSGADPGAPAQVLLDGVDAGDLPGAGVGEQSGGDVDEAGVLGVEVSGDLVQLVVESLVEVFVEHQHGTHSTRIPTYVRSFNTNRIHVRDDTRAAIAANDGSMSERTEGWAARSSQRDRPIERAGR